MKSQENSKQYIQNLLLQYGGEVSFISINFCPYCMAAKNLLTKLSIPFKEIKIDDPDHIENFEVIRNELIMAYNFRTFPQIFIGKEHIGGYQELKSLFDSKELYDRLNTLQIKYTKDEL
jgi:glutaredoxin 3